jgi:hypothetical protein
MLDAESEMQDFFIHRQHSESFHVYISIVKFLFNIDAGHIYTQRPLNAQSLIIVNEVCNSHFKTSLFMSSGGTT